MTSVEWETLKWVEWFNNRRLLEPIGYIPPAEAEERCYAQLGSSQQRYQIHHRDFGTADCDGCQPQ